MSVSLSSVECSASNFSLYWSSILMLHLCRYVSSELATDVMINVGEVKFCLHKVWSPFSTFSSSELNVRISWMIELLYFNLKWIEIGHVLLKKNLPKKSVKKRINDLFFPQIGICTDLTYCDRLFSSLSCPRAIASRN